MEKTEKQYYEAPSITVIEVRQESVICGSPTPQFGDSFGWDED